MKLQNWHYVYANLNIGCNPCIIFSNLNIQKIPKIASPINKINNSNQYAFNNFSESLKAPRHPINCRKPKDVYVKRKKVQLKI